MTGTLSGEMRKRLDAHLDAVEAALAGAGKSREERRGVVDDLEAQILDMIAARSATPTMEDVEAVLGKVDPPAAYAATAGVAPVAVSADHAPVAAAPAEVARQRYSRTAVWGLVCVVGSLLPLLILIPLVFFMGHTQVVASPKHAMPVREPTHLVPVPSTVETSPAGNQVIPLSPGQGATVLPNGTTVVTGRDESVKASPVAVRESIGKLPCVGIFVGPLGLLGTVLGWVAFGQIRASKGAIRGMGLALFDGLFYPVAIVLLILIGLILG